MPSEGQAEISQHWLLYNVFNAVALGQMCTTTEYQIIVQTGTIQKILQVFGPQLVQVTGKPEDQVTGEALLIVPSFNIRYSERQAVTSVYWNV